MAEMGYERTTMCAVAERAGSSIGSLYQFFPNKESVAEALRASYIGEVETLWAVLARKARTLEPRALAHEIVESEVGFARSHPAYLALLEAPPTVNSWRRRRMVRDRITRVLIAGNSSLTRGEATRAGSVVHQVVKGVLALYARAKAKEKPGVLKEFEAVLLGYLEPKLDKEQ